MWLIIRRLIMNDLFFNVVAHHDHFEYFEYPHFSWVGRRVVEKYADKVCDNHCSFFSRYACLSKKILALIKSKTYKRDGTWCFSLVHQKTFVFSELTFSQSLWGAFWTCLKMSCGSLLDVHLQMKCSKRIVRQLKSFVYYFLYAL